MNDTQTSLNSPSGTKPRVTSALRVCGLGAALALTTLSALGFAGDTVKDRAEASLRLPGTATVAALHRWLGTGRASWYGLRFQGHKTATGETFDMNDLTCAHRSLPLGSWVRVTNLRNHKSVVVRVNDRGPVSSDRIIDLSYAAAHAVGMDGIAKVKLEFASGPGFNPASPLVAQLGLPPSLMALPLQ